MQTKEINGLSAYVGSEKVDRESIGDRAAEPITIGIERKSRVENRVRAGSRGL